MMTIPALTDLEKHIIQQTIDERWGKGTVTAEEVEVEIRLSPADRNLTDCPAMYWEHEDCQFVLAKTGENSYRSQFFYSVRDRFGTGIEEYTDLADCVLYLLRLQADHESERKKNFPV
ncbi:MAG TPA: hypothetical protein PLE99_01225 [Candidatus Thiothrix moscowensis]|uniref:hypothetical protein n=1 Tax=unclassified Thiothrix TaxID=2636184 RepID=UPI001A2A0F59|nr:MULTISPECIES: hypothetical protein [unclassified Thiothrix]MBJ6611739.1 hypothetical protein [Candidatus Thiothrix moscowensis]HRJ51357.1 hypothetical protein [Candidatus Thiothrix moscowensis]HRJ91588.1 hypothetical protein [Candidatus Thiothrix moscowensis]